MRLAVRLTPRGGRDRIEGWGRDAAGRAFLKVRVAAPPVEGEANAALCRLIAKALGRLKSLEVEGVSEADVARAFGEPA